MPVRKVRDLRELEDALWREPGDPQLAKAIASVWSFAARTCPLRFPPGVYRHRTIEDAERLREQWEEANFRAFWERRGMRPEEVSGSRSELLPGEALNRAAELAGITKAQARRGLTDLKAERARWDRS